ncbi:hypothetical protein IGI04_040054 [Brassica rapa subsp. trilocularis]|uniref:Uncharacterized protein n=1 Tax=Brassica rapa subsp. trilocularis TaxID=1813537 RepID=A0ABQ7KLP7_BRACM|nr:hypothetical protein IGI04_040054 [Brassica rapa subsp. trilocularis]
MCTDGQPDVLCVLTDGHGRPVCADGRPRTSCTAHVGQNHPRTAKITREAKNAKINIFEESFLKGNIKNMSTKSLGCQVLIKSCCRHPFRPRNSDLCSMQKTWLEAKEIYENLPENSFNHPYEACKKSDSNSKYFFFYIKNTPRNTTNVYCLLPPSTRTVRVRSVGLFGPTLSRAGLRSMAGLSPVNFPGTFPANFLVDRFAPNFKFSRLHGLGLVSSVFQMCGALHELQSCSLTSGRSGGVLHVSWTCSQPYGARGAAVHASGAMRSDTRAATNLKLIGWCLLYKDHDPFSFHSSIPFKSKLKKWVRERERSRKRNFSTDFKSAPREGSGQLKINQLKINLDGKQVNVASSVQSAILYDCDAEALSNSIRPSQSYSPTIKWRCCPRLVQFHGFRSVEVLLDTPPKCPKNCPEARGGSVRVQISLSRPVNFFMVKPRLCPRQDQSIPVQSRRPLGFGQVFSDQPAASRLEHCELVPVIFKDSFSAGGWTIWVTLVVRVLGHIGRTTGTIGLCCRVECLVRIWNFSLRLGSRLSLLCYLVPSGFKETPYSLNREDSERRGHGLWLMTRRTVGCRAVTQMTVGRGRLKVLTLSPKSGLGTGLGLMCILVVDIKAMRYHWLADHCRFPLLEARSWQEAKSNLVTVALGKDDRIAWCWTLGPPVRVAKPYALTQRDESWSKVCDSDRIVPSPSRSASGPWCWVGRSVMFLFDCWLAGWPFISNPWCGSSVGHFWLDCTHSFRISPNPGTKSVKENATKQPAFANPETVLADEMQPACAQVSAKSILTGALKPKRVNSFSTFISTLAHQYAWPRSYQGKMLTLGWMMESRASISTTWTNQTDLDSPVHQNSSLCPDQYTDQSTGRASMLICVLTWCISCPKSVHGQSTEGPAC